MTPFLILGLALVATSGVLMLRSFALASTERRRTLDQISAYGFNSAAVAEESADLRASFGDLAEATGENALARFERLRSGERGLRELLDSALDANLALVSVGQNEDVKRLAAWAAIIAIPTMIAGVYGMNFNNMPELGWRWGYPAALGSMVLIYLYLVYRFRKAGWF